MHQAKKGKQHYFGANITQVDKLQHGEENVVCADAGYTGVEKRPEHDGRPVTWQIAARRSTYKKHGKRSALYNTIRKIDRAEAQIGAEVEPTFRVIKRQFGYTEVRFLGLVKNTAQVVMSFALLQLWMGRRHLLVIPGGDCNSGNGRCKVLAAAKNTEVSG